MLIGSGMHIVQHNAGFGHDHTGVGADVAN